MFGAGPPSHLSPPGAQDPILRSASESSDCIFMRSSKTDNFSDPKKSFNAPLIIFTILFTLCSNNPKYWKSKILLFVIWERVISSGFFLTPNVFFKTLAKIIYLQNLTPPKEYIVNNLILNVDQLVRANSFLLTDLNHFFIRIYRDIPMSMQNFPKLFMRYREVPCMHGSRSKAQQYGGELTLLYKKET